MIKKYFVKTLADMNSVNVAKKENSYMFLTTPQFKFLDVKNYLAPGLSLDAWCKANGCEIEKSVFPYEWLDDYEKLSQVGPVKYEDFYSSLKGRVYLSGEAKYYDENQFYETVLQEFDINLKVHEPSKDEKERIENTLRIRLEKMVYNKDLYENF